MIEINGTCHGSVTMQAGVSIPNRALHALALITVAGVHSSADELWNGAQLTYWSMGDLLAGAGKISGYFHNRHVNGDTTFGTFEADVTMRSLLQSITIGKWQLGSGTGRFQGISGGGRFESKSETPVTFFQMTWSGEYNLPD